MEPTQNLEPKSSSNTLAIPLAIVVAGALIAGAVFFKGSTSTRNPGSQQQAKEVTGTIEPVSAEDHVLGNPNAPVKIVEYSDLQCPYCQQFHKVMEEVMATAGKEGKVAWVYRHFWPVNAKMSNGEIYHPLGGKAIEASECAAEIGGNDKFWAFIGNIFDDSETQQSKLEDLSGTAVAVGLDKQKFEACIAGTKYENKLPSFYTAGKKAGVDGTPNSFIIGPNGTTPLPGAGYSADEIIQSIESVL